THDTIGVSFKCPTPTPSARRELLSVTNALYDPLGLMIEWDMAGRLLMRAAATFDWDTPLPNDLQEKARSFVEKLTEAVRVFSVKRRIHCDRLVCYVDASNVAWGVDIYTTDGVRVRAKGGLFSKEKRDKWTVPRKELLALIYGRQLLMEIWKSVPESKRSCCSALILSDSQINCYRLHKEAQAVGTKAWEIKNITALRGWLSNHNVKLRHVVTNLNSADAITRGVCYNEVKEADVKEAARWWVEADCEGEAPWGPTIDFKFEDLEIASENQAADDEGEDISIAGPNPGNQEEIDDDFNV
ncbi:hypothetical protein FOZ63_014965, partial [Perkinsus olseni]